LSAQKEPWGAFAVFDPVRRLHDRARAAVDAHHVLAADRLVELHPLVGAHLVGLDHAPRQLAALGALVLGPDAVAPVVAGREVTPGPPHLRDLKLAGGFDDVLLEAVGVGERRGRVVDRAVEGVEAEVGPVEADRLHEHAVDARVDLVDDAIDVDPDRGGGGAERPEQEEQGSEEALHLGGVYYSRGAEPDGLTRTGA
jgi:hypothetical protein